MIAALPALAILLSDFIYIIDIRNYIFGCRIVSLPDNLDFMSFNHRGKVFPMEMDVKLKLWIPPIKWKWSPLISLGERKQTKVAFALQKFFAFPPVLVVSYGVTVPIYFCNLLQNFLSLLTTFVQSFKPGNIFCNLDGYCWWLHHMKVWEIDSSGEIDSSNAILFLF